MQKDKLKKLKQQREENFKALGQYMLQKQYYENMIEELLANQKELCHTIMALERGL